MNTRGLATCIIIGLCATATGAAAQQPPYEIQRPGQLPTFVEPQSNGGYIVHTPGQNPTFVTPLGNGGYESRRAGDPLPTFIRPSSPSSSRPCRSPTIAGRC